MTKKEELYKKDRESKERVKRTGKEYVIYAGKGSGLPALQFTLS